MRIRSVKIKIIDENEHEFIELNASFLNVFFFNLFYSIFAKHVCCWIQPLILTCEYIYNHIPYQSADDIWNWKRNEFDKIDYNLLHQLFYRPSRYYQAKDGLISKRSWLLFRLWPTGSTWNLVKGGPNVDLIQFGSIKASTDSNHSEQLRS